MSSIGPALPPGFKRSHDDSEDTSQPEVKVKKSGGIGPSLPPGFKRQQSSSSSDDSDDDDDVIGPLLPSGDGEADTSAASIIAKRAEKFRKKLLNEVDPEDVKPKARETWMTELPKQNEITRVTLMPVAKSRLGDGKMQIDHSWTRNPGEKEPSTDVKEPGSEEPDYVPNERDQKMAAEVAEFNKSRRAASLMDMHQKKLDKKKKKKEKKEKKEMKRRKKKGKREEDKKSERREFDRDVDLKANVFDDAKKKALIKKSQILNTRFGHGSTAYL